MRDAPRSPLGRALAKCSYWATTFGDGIGHVALPWRALASHDRASTLDRLGETLA